MDSKAKSSTLSSARTSSIFLADKQPERDPKDRPKDSTISLAKSFLNFSLREKSKPSPKDRPKKGAWPPTPGFRHDLKKSWAKHTKDGYRFWLETAAKDGNVDEV